MCSYTGPCTTLGARFVVVSRPPGRRCPRGRATPADDTDGVSLSTCLSRGAPCAMGKPRAAALPAALPSTLAGGMSHATRRLHAAVKKAKVRPIAVGLCGPTAPHS